MRLFRTFSNVSGDTAAIHCWHRGVIVDTRSHCWHRGVIVDTAESLLTLGVIVDTRSHCWHAESLLTPRNHCTRGVFVDTAESLLTRGVIVDTRSQCCHRGVIVDIMASFWHSQSPFLNRWAKGLSSMVVIVDKKRFSVTQRSHSWHNRVINWHHRDLVDTAGSWLTQRSRCWHREIVVYTERSHYCHRRRIVATAELFLTPWSNFSKLSLDSTHRPIFLKRWNILSEMCITLKFSLDLSSTVQKLNDKFYKWFANKKVLLHRRLSLKIFLNSSYF